MFLLDSQTLPLSLSLLHQKVQKSHQVYDGAFHAFRKIVGQEGIKGLYRGFMINSIQVVSGCAYILTLEKMRDVCSTTFDIRDNALKGLIAGGLSSMVSQTINTPFDVVSQHLMLLNKQKSSLDSNSAAAKNAVPNATQKAAPNVTPNTTKNVAQNAQHLKNSQENLVGKKYKVKPLSIDTRSLTRFQINLAVIRQLYKTDGPAGFYRGYFASLVQYIPRYITFGVDLIDFQLSNSLSLSLSSSMLFWIFYPTYSQLMVDFHKSSRLVPKEKFSKQPIDLLAGKFSKLTCFHLQIQPVNNKLQLAVLTTQSD